MTKKHTDEIRTEAVHIALTSDLSRKQILTLQRRMTGFEKGTVFSRRSGKY